MFFTKIKKNQGFTIVETLIVLAIAALILIIVLIAVPDLQRSAKNSNIRSDAQNVASAIQTFEGNNQGLLPGVVKNTNGVISVTGPSGNAGIASTGHMQASTTISPVISSTTPETYSANNNTTIYVELNAQCPASSSGAVTPTPNQRGIAIIYPIDSGGTFNGGCIQD